MPYIGKIFNLSMLIHKGVPEDIDKIQRTLSLDKSLIFISKPNSAIWFILKDSVGSKIGEVSPIFSRSGEITSRKKQIINANHYRAGIKTELTQYYDNQENLNKNSKYPFSVGFNNELRTGILKDGNEFDEYIKNSFFPFYFKDLRTNEYAIFNATLTSLTEN
jgi:hypothetical protein